MDLRGIANVACVDLPSRYKNKVCERMRKVLSIRTIFAEEACRWIFTKPGSQSLFRHQEKFSTSMGHFRKEFIHEMSLL